MANNETKQATTPATIGEILLAEYATNLGRARRQLFTHTAEDQRELAILRTAYHHNGPTDLAESMLRQILGGAG